MKKLVRFMLYVMLVASVATPIKNASAGDIDAKTARQVGAYFMSAQFGNKAITPASLNQVYEIANIELNIPALYVFNTANNSGFVIVSGSECISPIVAYSTEGGFDPNNIPPNMLWWLNGIANEVAYAQNNKLEASPTSLDSWKELTEENLPYFGQNSKDIIRLLSTKWNQNYPYNTLCPAVSGGTSDIRGHAYVGCVATAMAQIIRYWEYPRVGKSGYAYQWNGQVLDVDFSSAYYDYDQMPNQLTSSSTNDEIYAVSLLGYHCGVSVRMSYSADGSGTSSSYVSDALRKYFKYVKDSLNYIERTGNRYGNPNSTTSPNIKDTNWVYDIRDQILKRRPVYYSGYSPAGGQDAGHAFVCEGWNSSTKTLFFNWGWGGSGDCWCNVFISKLKPAQNIGGTTYNFTDSHKAVLGITPPDDSIHFVGIEVVENPFIGAAYPNPAKTEVTVTYNLNGNSNVLMQIFDATGRIVKQTEVSPISNQITISVADLRPGIYICRLNGYTQKFVVQ